MTTTPNTESVDATLITAAVVTMADWDEVQEKAREHGPGAFFYYDYVHGEGQGYRQRETGICIVCPGDEYARQIPTDGTRGWRLEVGGDKPTITPSIQTHQWDGEARQMAPLWHGYMTAGRLVSC